MKTIGLTAGLTLLALLLMLPHAQAETRIMVVSDIHYLDKELYEGSELFLRVLKNGDGKITQYGDELLSALYREILAQRPDALIVTGDLTFNGEKKSHLSLAAWFKTVEDAGVPVWVIPGNHDINVHYPLGFSKNGWYTVEEVTAEEFEAIYADFLLPGQAGFSYAAPIGDRLRVAMTDVAYYEEEALTFGVFTPAHAAWLESVFRQAQADDIQVICATHHSMISHTQFSQESFLMFGHEDMAALLRQYGARLNLSGHLHIQHAARQEGLTDVATGAFCMWPHRYAVVALTDEGRLTYEARGLSGDFLPEGFLEESRDWFADITKSKFQASLTEKDEADAEAMADYAARFNLAYFSGAYTSDDPAWREDPAYALWEREGDGSFWRYMRLVMNEPNDENLMFVLEK